MNVAADVVVVGGGSSGAALAGLLAAAGREVILLEAGPDYGPSTSGRWPAELLDARMLATTHDWNYTSGPVAGREPWTFERARVIGGCSAHNGAIAAVGHRQDYDAWGLTGWSTDELRPAFARVIERMQVRTYDRAEARAFHARCLDVAGALGWTMASDLCDLDANTSFGLESVNVTTDGVRWNTAFAYLDPVRDLPNLRIIDEVLVDRIVDHSNGATIHAHRHRESFALTAGTVVLSAGVYGTPAILQRSGVGDPARLRAAGVTTVVDLPGVGGNLHDHPMVHTDREIGRELAAEFADAMATGFLPEEQTLGKAVSSQATDGIFDLHVFPIGVSTQTALVGGRVLVEVACVTPRSRGRLDIVCADPTVAPRIDHGYLTDPDDHDINVLRDGLAMADEILDHPLIAPLLGRRLADVSTDAAIRRRVLHYYHPVGTCQMGTDNLAVCDARGRVYGLDHVVIADASLMPQIPRANTNLPAIVIGEQIAAMLMHTGP